jgi:hypothetical protein
MVNGRLPKRVARSCSRASAIMRTTVLARDLAARQRLLQILIKCRLFEICEKIRLIHLEYGQKTRAAQNQYFKLCW